MLLHQILPYTKITKNTYKNNKLKKSALTMNKELELTNGSYSVSDV